MREIKFRAWNKHDKYFERMDMSWIFINGVVAHRFWNNSPLEKHYDLQQYTGLKDKNGMGLTEIYEGDIISIDGTLKGNIYENDKEPTDIIIPQLGTKAWADAYKEAVERGYDYSE